jgi:phosphoglycolate phosphatase
MYKALFLDLDGTLLDTLTDIRSAINDALQETGFAFHYSKQECRSLVGYGADALVHKALGDLDSPENFAKLKAAYMPLYGAYQEKHTKPFNGMAPTLEYLANKGVLLFVSSNKPDELASIVVRKYYGDSLFTEIRGQRPLDLPKPNPNTVLALMDKYQLKGSECLYVGDSLPDLLTAQNAKLPFCLCKWGYGFYKPEFLEEATYIIGKPKDLAKVALSL